MTVDTPRTMAYAERPCVCVGDHRPLPETVELHHLHPQFDQRRLWGEVRDKELVPLCGTAHNNVHVYLSWLLAQHEGKAVGVRPTVGYYHVRIAKEGLRRILAAREQAAEMAVYVR